MIVLWIFEENIILCRLEIICYHLFYYNHKILLDIISICFSGTSKALFSSKKICKIFQILRYIEYLDACMEYEI